MKKREKEMEYQLKSKEQLVEEYKECITKLGNHYREVIDTLDEKALFEYSQVVRACVEEAQCYVEMNRYITNMIIKYREKWEKVRNERMIKSIREECEPRKE